MHKKKFMRFLAMTMAGAMVLTGVPIGLNSDGQIYSSVVEAKAEEVRLTQGEIASKYLKPTSAIFDVSTNTLTISKLQDEIKTIYIKLENYDKPFEIQLRKESEPDNRWSIGFSKNNGGYFRESACDITCNDGILKVTNIENEELLSHLKNYTLISEDDKFEYFDRIKLYTPNEINIPFDNNKAINFLNHVTYTTKNGDTIEFSKGDVTIEENESKSEIGKYEERIRLEGKELNRCFGFYNPASPYPEESKKIIFNIVKGNLQDTTIPINLEKRFSKGSIGYQATPFIEEALRFNGIDNISKYFYDNEKVVSANIVHKGVSKPIKVEHRSDGIIDLWYEYPKNMDVGDTYKAEYIFESNHFNKFKVICEYNIVKDSAGFVEGSLKQVAPRKFQVQFKEPTKGKLSLCTVGKTQDDPIYRTDNTYEYDFDITDDKTFEIDLSNMRIADEDKDKIKNGVKVVAKYTIENGTTTSAKSNEAVLVLEPGSVTEINAKSGDTKVEVGLPKSAFVGDKIILTINNAKVAEQTIRDLSKPTITFDNLKALKDKDVVEVNIVDSINQVGPKSKLIVSDYLMSVVNGSIVDRKNNKITIKANKAAEGKEFDKWVVKKGKIKLEDASKETTTFVKTAEDIEIEATYKDVKTTTPSKPSTGGSTTTPTTPTTPSTGGSTTTGSSSSSSSSSSSTVTPPVTQKPAEEKKEEPKKEEVKKTEEQKKDEAEVEKTLPGDVINTKAKATKSESKATVKFEPEVTAKTAKIELYEDVIQAAVKDAKSKAKTDKAKENLRVVVDAKTNKNKVLVSLSDKAVKTLANKNIKNFKVVTKTGKVTLGKKALKQIDKKTKNGAKIVLEKNNGKSYKLTVKDVNNKDIKGITGTMKVTLPVKLKKGQKVYMNGKAVKAVNKGDKVIITVKSLGKITIK